MSWINNLFGNNNSYTMNEGDIAIELLIASKAEIDQLTKAVIEAVNPDLRDILRNQLDACINEHYRLVDIVSNKGWYKTYSNPQNQIKQDLNQIQDIIGSTQ
ncbi:spore coat protein [Clostridium omnivorum]|uniref:Spore coat protein n=1 Tax=Clostridium omnivorum TaxID=1604902 RepID=A0ABQ5N7R5_9CLOT|nr:spore coat protein [Clostridium sp. E14]GLC31259.1 hypothetical protein bsdE14_26690 [Clostridium sp. E14]